jgi:hypothetical protein
MMKNKNSNKVAPLLSPKKFVETKARNLPIYECYVNSDWKETHMANVVVMRKHANEKITAGIYLVDLLCLGVKDTVYVYNDEELGLKERVFESQNDDLQFEKIDYMLAHNIVYAGHDFALEFGIKPDAEFATTKYILEDDTDDIELIDIEVGDKEGNPVLIVKQSGQYADALMKLKKNAGEGNYTYLVEGESFGEEDFDESEYDDLDDYLEGEINPFAASNIKSSDLLDKDKVSTRSRPEMFSLQIEVYLRLLLDNETHFVYEAGIEFDWIDGALSYPEYITDVEIANCEAALDELKAEALQNNYGDRFNEIVMNILDKYSPNLLLASTFHLQELMGANDEMYKKTTELLQPFVSKHPLAVLTLAIYELVKNGSISAYDYILHEEDLRKIFPQVVNFSAIELLIFFLMKVVKYTRDNNLKQALKYYQLVSNINVSNWVLLPVQSEFLAFIDGHIKESIGSAESPTF